MNKKAQSISINTIIVAVIALIVMVVMIAIFSGKINLFTGGTRSCATQQGECSDDCTKVAESHGGGTYINVPGTNCEDDKSSTPKKLCCVPIIKPESP